MQIRHWIALAAVASLQAPPTAAKPPYRPPRATLFHCTTDHRLTLIPRAADGDGQRFDVASRVPDHRDIRLSIDRRDRTLQLSIGHGADAQDYVLHDVKQGSTPGSGTGGKADSAITGTSGDQSFLLYAGYDNNGFDFSADLQITGAQNIMFTCNDRIYDAPVVPDIGSHGGTNIYSLAYGGLAQQLVDIPDIPDPDSPILH